MSARKLILVDGSCYLYRAFHALPPLTNSQGRADRRGARRAQHAEQDDQGGSARSGRRGVRRAGHARFATICSISTRRTARPCRTTCARKCNRCYEAVAAMGVPLLRVAGVEADDVIGTLAVQGGRRRFRSADLDRRQGHGATGGPHIELVNTMSNTRLDRAGVKAKFDVFPEQIVDYLALVGDSSDNIPGITSVGPKTAAKWLNQYQTLDALVARAADIRGKVGENLRGELADARVVAQARDHRYRGGARGDSGGAGRGRPRRRSGCASCTPAGAAGAAQVAGTGAPPCTAPRAPSNDVAGRSERRSARKSPRRSPCVAHRRRANTRRSVLGRGVGSWLAKLERRAAHLLRYRDRQPGLHARANGRPVVRRRARARRLTYRSGTTTPARRASTRSQQGAGALRSRCSRTLAKAKLGHHLKFDAHILANYGVALQGQRFDSMLESYVLEQRRNAPRHGFDRREIPGHQDHHTYEEVAGKGAKQIPFNQVDVDRAAEYAAEDADVTLQLHQALWPQIEARSGAEVRLRNHRAAAGARSCSGWSATGVLVDRALLRAQSAELAARMLELQIAGARRGGRHRSTWTRRSSCRRSCSASSAFRWCARRRPVSRPPPRMCSRSWPQTYRAAEIDPGISRRGQTQIHLYRQAAAEQINRRTGRIHTSYHQAVAATGRLSSSDPNLQNIPIRTPRGGASGRHSSRRRAIRWSPRIIRRSSCASWRIYRAMRALLQRVRRGSRHTSGDRRGGLRHACGRK